VINISKLEEKNRNEIKRIIVREILNELLDKINNRIEKGINSFDAYNSVIDNYEMEEEITLKYEIEAEKIIIDDIDIKPEEVEKIKNRIEKKLFNTILEKNKLS